jgi:Mg/Co/Ni transporter MgtE
VRIVGLLLAIALGAVVAAVTVHNTVFIAELGVPGATAAMVVVLYAARQLNVSPTEAVDMIRSPRSGPRS